MKGLHISWGGPDRRIKDEAGRVWLFEDHPRFGLIVLKKNGEPKVEQPGSRSPFWRVWQWWRDGGKRVGEDGMCVWEKPAEQELVHLGGRNYALARSKLAQRYGKA